MFVKGHVYVISYKTQGSLQLSSGGISPSFSLGAPNQYDTMAISQLTLPSGCDLRPSIPHQCQTTGLCVIHTFNTNTGIMGKH